MQEAKLKEAEYQSLLARIKHDLFAPPTVQMIDIHGDYQDDNVEWLTPPEYATQGSAAVDLRWNGRAYGKGYNSGFVVRPGERVKLGTGLKIHCESKQVAALALPRSGLGSKGLVISNLVGLIDPDYQGEWMITLWNASDEDQEIRPGDRLIQAVFFGLGGIIQPRFEFVSCFDAVTDRGEGGFGSTGK